MNTRTRVKAAEAPVEQTASLHTKYRPAKLADVIGQNHAVKSIKSNLAQSARPHTFLFTGPAGTGKTTLARIIAGEVGVSGQNLIEVDAASTSGVDGMRELTSALRYQGFGDNPNKLIIIDECHALSTAAWQALLKATEEPPAHVYFAFCTTAPGKVPDTIRTRAAAYDLKPVKRDDILDLLEKVCDAEGYDTPNRHLDMIASACSGSPRQALVQLSMVHACEDDDEVATLLEQPLEDKEIIELCRAYVGGSLTWVKLTATLKAMSAQSPESIRIVIVNYMAACMMGAKSDQQAERLLHMVEPFTTPFNQSDKLAPLLVAFGKVIL
jgi:DNA polymerase III gamma/tau subunit